MNELAVFALLLGSFYGVLHLTVRQTRTLKLGWCSIQWSTTHFNGYFSTTGKLRAPSSALPTALSPWNLFSDVGTILILHAVLVAQGVLVFATVRSVQAVRILLHERRTVLPGMEPGVPRRLMKRAVQELVVPALKLVPMGSSATASLLLRPVLPGLTTPLSAMPLLVLALLLAQTFHEIGHAVAAASESIPLLACGINVYLFLPTFFISLPSSSSASNPSLPSHSHGSSGNAVADLRISTAGVWYSLVLVGLAWGASEKGFAVGRRTTGWMGRQVEGGVVVVGVEKSSPLAPHLPPFTLITHLNDLELDTSTSPADLWSSYLHDGTTTLPSTWFFGSSGKKSRRLRLEGEGIGERYDNMGWCLPLDAFDGSNHGKSCCSTFAFPLSMAPTSISPSHDDPDAHLLCFAIPPSPSSYTSLKACLNPLSYSLFPPFAANPSSGAYPPPRCLRSGNCRKGLGCARPEGGEMVLRIGVSDLVELPDGRGRTKTIREARTVVWQGVKRGVLEQVQVSNVLPRFWWIPLGWFKGLEMLFSHLQSLSLAIAFFNLLPLPSLDGSAIIEAFLASITLPLPPTQAMLRQSTLRGHGRSTSMSLSLSLSNTGLHSHPVSPLLGTSIPSWRLLKTKGVLIWFLSLFARKGQAAERSRERRILRWIKAWTWGAGALLLVCSAGVEIFAGSNREVGKV